ncbi:hypothetical protein L2E82_49416 [Cichorium intybus]|uniref:Uncharacterized protein n=1 Tax=Cichorium intybus TaxID=13427 RepID=A0ACB8Z0W1_CICIN|nr:hypothetical protein L2E82_49416 [Cichorium intybus]
MELLLILLLLGNFHLVVPDIQGDALFDLRTSLKASPDQLTDWNQNQVNPCTWSKVSCDSNSNVLSVSMSFMGFTGTLSPRIRVLSKLTILSLQGNQITGEIPEEYGNLSSLTMLDLESNQLTGKIPSSLGNLKNLQFLILSQNNLEGSIPDSLSSLPNLTSILLGYNNLSGQIPDHLFQVSKYNFTGNNLNCGFNNTHPCASSSGDSSKKSMAGIVIGVIGGVLGLLLLGCLVLFLWRGRHKGYKREVFVDVAVALRLLNLIPPLEEAFSFLGTTILSLALIHIKGSSRKLVLLKILANPRLTVKKITDSRRIRWHAVASWTWDAHDETCGICRMPFDGCCPDCKLPGDDCPLIWGACNHAFHLHCILKWVNSQTPQAHCPMCRREWQFKE